METKQFGGISTAIVLGGAVIVAAIIWLNHPNQDLVGEPESVAENTDSLTTDSTSCGEPLDADVRLETSEDTLTHRVFVDDVMVLEVDAEEELGMSESAASIFRRTDCYVYVEITMTGRGGYILYGGPDVLYRINLASKEAERISITGFLMDISPDETMVASMDYRRDRQVEIMMLNGQQTKEFRVPAPYNDAGGGLFSPDSKWFVYGAVVRAFDGAGNPTQQAVITVDLTTGEQTVAEADVREGHGVYITGWTKGNQPIVSDEL